MTSVTSSAPGEGGRMGWGVGGLGCVFSLNALALLIVIWYVLVAETVMTPVVDVLLGQRYTL